MAKIIGKEPLTKYSCEIYISELITVSSLLMLMDIPSEMHEDIMVIRNRKILYDSDLISDNDEILLYPVVMGG